MEVLLSKRLIRIPTRSPPTPDQNDWTEAEVPAHHLVRNMMGTSSTKLIKAMTMPIITVLPLRVFSVNTANSVASKSPAGL